MVVVVVYVKMREPWPFQESRSSTLVMLLIAIGWCYRPVCIWSSGCSLHLIDKGSRSSSSRTKPLPDLDRSPWFDTIIKRRAIDIVGLDWLGPIFKWPRNAIVDRLLWTRREHAEKHHNKQGGTARPDRDPLIVDNDSLLKLINSIRFVRQIDCQFIIIILSFWSYWRAAAADLWINFLILQLSGARTTTAPISIVIPFAEDLGNYIHTIWLRNTSLWLLFINERTPIKILCSSSSRARIIIVWDVGQNMNYDFTTLSSALWETQIRWHYLKCLSGGCPRCDLGFCSNSTPNERVECKLLRIVIFLSLRRVLSRCGY